MPLTATLIKEWFQYRCDRKACLDLMGDLRLQEIPVQFSKREAQQKFWNDFELDSIASLERKGAILKASVGEHYETLSEHASGQFLVDPGLHRFAYQLNLGEDDTWVRERNPGLPFRVGRSIPDLVEAYRHPEGLSFQISDFKAVQQAANFHRIQVAYYSLVLENLLNVLNRDGQARTVHPEGAIIFLPHTVGLPARREVFPLAPYRRMLQEFMERDLPRILDQANRPYDPASDSPAFHLYFKCEACRYLPHCRLRIEGPSPAAWDACAVPGLSPQTKDLLQHYKARTVGDLAALSPTAISQDHPSLRRRVARLSERARSLLSQAPRRLPGAQSFLMPDRVDVAFHLSLDVDAVSNTIVRIGYLKIEDGVESTCLRLIQDETPAHEFEALWDILGCLCGELAAIDQWNSSTTGIGKIVHIFLYESHEGSDLKEALGRHLHRPEIRTGLLDLLRMFPPENVIPDPTYRDLYHFPATALRPIMERLYALPVKVSHDLPQVSAALALDHVHAPSETLRKEFSGSLALDAIRQFRKRQEGAPTPAELDADLLSRLRAQAALAAFLIRENQKAEEPFLRLSKQPFRLSQSFNPLGLEELDMLMALELLDSHSGLLATLGRLALPVDERYDAGTCIPNLSVEHIFEVDASGLHRIELRIPAGIGVGELTREKPFLILHRDDPAIRLVPAAWGSAKVRIAELDRSRIIVETKAKILIKNLRAESAGWCIEEAFYRGNHDRCLQFLQGLTGEPA